MPAIENTAHWEFAQAAAILSQGLSGREFILGDRFSVADILVAQPLAAGSMAAVE